MTNKYRFPFRIVALVGLCVLMSVLLMTGACQKKIDSPSPSQNSGKQYKYYISDSISGTYTDYYEFLPVNPTCVRATNTGNPDYKIFRKELIICGSFHIETL